jgi:hypothetical protein
VYDTLYAEYRARYRSVGEDLNGVTRIYYPESVASHQDIDVIIEAHGGTTFSASILEDMRALVGQPGRKYG